MQARANHCLVVVVLLSGLVALACHRDSSDSSIKLGAVLPLTGDSAGWGQQGRWGIESAVADVNASGGIDGRPIDVLFEDSQAQPRLAVNAAQKLISVHGVQAIVGDIVSATTLAMAPIAESNRVVLIAPTASAPSISQAGDYVFRLWPSDYLEGTELAHYLARINCKRVAVLYISTEYGQGLLDAFRGAFERDGGAVVLAQGYNQDETNFRTQLLRVESTSPDAVYLISYYRDAASVLRQAKELGIRRQFIGATAVESRDLLALAGDSAEGLVYPTIVDFDVNNPTDRQKQFISTFRARHGTDPDWASSHTYDAVMILADTLKAGARTGSDIRQRISSQREFIGVTGRIQFDDRGDVINKPVAMKIVRDGKFIALGSDLPPHFAARSK